MAVSMETWVNTQQAYYNSGVRELSQIKDFSATQNKARSIVDTFKENNERVRTLQSESNDFLKTYSAGMNAQSQAASRLTGDGVSSVLKPDTDGNVAKENVQNAVSAARNMVSQYNDNLRLLNDNIDRGPGVTQQLSRMVQDPAPAEDLGRAGITVNNDGTLSLNEQILAEALAAPDTREETASALRSVAEGVQEDARAGLAANSSELVSRDVSRVETIREEDPIRKMASDLKGMGGAAMNNYFMAMSGSLMNMLV